MKQLELELGVEGKICPHHINRITNDCENCGGLKYDCPKYVTEKEGQLSETNDLYEFDHQGVYW